MTGQQSLMSVRIGDGHVMEESRRGRSRIAEKVRLLPLVALAAPQKRAVVEHVLGHGIQRPVIALARIAWLARDFHEAVVQAQIVADRVLPSGKPVAVVREAVHYELANAAQCQLFVWRRQNGHGDQSDVRVRRLD